MTLIELMRLLRKHLAAVIAFPVVCALAMGAASFLFMPNTYTASTSMYVLTKGSGADAGITSTDLSASQMITNDVAALIKSDRVMKDTAKSLGMKSLEGYEIGVKSETTTRVVSLSVSGEDAQSTAIVANRLARDVSTVAQEVMDVQSINVIDEATAPEKPSGPNRVMYVAAAFFGGLFAAVMAVVLVNMLDTRVRGVAAVEELLGLPVIGCIPVMREGR